MDYESAVDFYIVVAIAVCIIIALLIIRFGFIAPMAPRRRLGKAGAIQIGNGQTIGRRAEQDDYFASMTTPVGTLAVVADGISGLQNGRMSSTLAVTIFTREFAKLERADELEEYFARAAQKSNREILQNLNGQGGGTTLAAAVITGGKLHYGAVGDSLITLFRNGEFVPVNSKHTAETLLEEKVLTGEMSREEAVSSPVRRQLTNYLGYEGFERMEIGEDPVPLRADDLVLLVSDGVHEALTEIELEQILLQQKTPQDMAEDVIDAIEAKGLRGQDNATVVILREDAC
ncbi:serine/threonine protein phosphatase PrpC [Paenibacillus forsythiae]|uniref:Serine/threonine protein phosphatase PrpC n=1 Tax=Paenibacillus forsythiae TaxID=365616 RepID=A0ABU3HDU2_9BACL|nr:serine/threonine protein phosphatase PrpC [Paenibacillus forsythiae]